MVIDKGQCEQLCYQLSSLPPKLVQLAMTAKAEWFLKLELSTGHVFTCI